MAKAEPAPLAPVKGEQTRERPVSHRRRFALGVAFGSIVGIGLAWALLSGALREQSARGAERACVVPLRALAELVSRAGGGGDAVRRVVAAFHAAHPDLPVVRVVAFDGVSLEASTDSADTGEKTPPRRLAHDEKPLYDRGQRIRAAVETNAQENSARKDEIEAEPLASGALSLAAPVETNGAVSGFVEVQTAARAPARGEPIGPALVHVVAPVAAFLLLALLIGERRGPLTAAALLLIVANLFLYARHSVARLEKAEREGDASVAALVTSEAAAAEAQLAALALPAAPPLAPASWDSDSYRRPLGHVTPDLRVDEAKLSARVAHEAALVRRALVLVGLLSLGLAAFVGFGGAAAFGRTVRDNRQAYLYTIPAFVGMLVLVFFPFLYGIALSFTDANIYNTGRSLREIFIGFRNYVDIVGDFNVARRAADGSLLFNYLNFYWTFFITVVWTISNVTIGVTVGLVLALALNTKGLALKPIYRVLLILPWAMPNYITALIWKGMFHQQFGVINQMLQVVGLKPLSWFEKPFTSFLTALATNGWLSFPFMMVISLGALQSIPADLYEAARVDGATRWQQFRKITLPSIKPALIPAIIISVVWTFNMFNIIFLVTEGQPDSATEILITQAYKFAFQRYRYGYAAAYSTIIFAILLAYGTFQNKVTKATEAM
jgi:arabinogalactan oligomer/maltooligosaccharide transport system permease protein